MKYVMLLALLCTALVGNPPILKLRAYPKIPDIVKSLKEHAI